MKNALIVCGEHSADKYGANLIKEIKKRTDIEFWGIGGENLKKEGVELIYDLNDMSIFGFKDALKNLRKIIKIKNNIVELSKKRKPAFSIHIDYPDFNIQLAGALKKSGIKTYYYIPPTVWAWRYKRIKKVKNNFHHVFLIFPFEEKIYKKEGIPYSFVGHPVFEVIENEFNRNLKFKEKFNIKNDFILLMPGSRRSELISHTPTLIEAVKKIKKFFSNIDFVVVKPESLVKEFFSEYIKNKINIVDEKFKYSAMNETVLSISTSGTTNFELLTFLKPFIVIYRLNESKLFELFVEPILKKAMKIKNYSIVNILSGKELVKELIQKDLTAENIFNEFKKLYTEKENLKVLHEQFKKLLLQYKDRRNPSTLIADKITKYL